MVVLNWITQEKELKQFVRNRVNSIRENTRPEDWRHCPGKDNPADLVSRGISSDGKLDQGNWWHGPTWLTEGKEFWPKNKLEVDDESYKLIADEEKTSSTTLFASSVSVVDFLRLSKFNKLVRCFACELLFVVRFYTNARSKVRLNRHSKALSVEEIRAAEF